MENDNPYSTPSGELLVESRQSRCFSNRPLKKSFGDGGRWVSSAFHIFKLSPGKWVILGLVFWLLSIGLNALPVVGYLLSFLTTLFLGAVCWIAHRLYNNEKPSFMAALAGLEGSFKSLVGLGLVMLLINLFSIVLAIGIVGIAMGDTILSILFEWVFGDGNYTQILAKESIDSVNVLLAVLLSALIIIFLTLPAYLAYWFSPPLIVINELPVFQAMKLSFTACLRNVLPFLLYGLISLIAILVAIVPLGLGLLVAAPVLLISMYTSYHSVFYAEEEGRVNQS